MSQPKTLLLFGRHKMRRNERGSYAGQHGTIMRISPLVGTETFCAVLKFNQRWGPKRRTPQAAARDLERHIRKEHKRLGKIIGDGE